MFVVFLVLLPFRCSAPDGVSTHHSAGGFVLSAEVISAIEGGPVILKVSLRYDGAEELHICPPDYSGQLGIRTTADRSWRRQPLYRTLQKSVNHSPALELTVQRGDKWERILYLHHSYRSISPGKAQIRLEHSVYPPRKSLKYERTERTEPMMRLSLDLSLDVQRATPEALQLIAEQLQNNLRQTPDGAKQQQNVADTILGSTHAEFIPVALSLLRSRYRGSKDKLIEFVYERCQTVAAGNDVLVRYLLEDRPDEAARILDYWRDIRWQGSLDFVSEFIPSGRDILRCLFLSAVRRHDHRLWLKLHYVSIYVRSKQFALDDRHIHELCGAPNVWVRALTYANFADRCDREWAATLLDSLRAIGQPLAADELRRLIVDLNDKRFPIRERAAADLLRRGDVVAPALRELLKNPPSPEVEQRVKRILADIEKTPLDPLAQRTIAHLASLAEPNSAARSMLEVLAKGAPGTRLTEQARKALESARHRQPK